MSQPFAGHAAFLDATTQIGFGPTRRPDDPRRWRRYLPDGDGLTVDEARRSFVAGPACEVAVDETTGFADIRAIVSQYPGMALEQLTPFARPRPAHEPLPLGGAAILPSRYAPMKRRRHRTYFLAAVIAVGAAAVASVLLAALG